MADKSSCCSCTLFGFLRWFLFVFCTFNTLFMLVMFWWLARLNTFLVELNYPGLSVGWTEYTRTAVLFALALVGSYGAATGNFKLLRFYGLATFIHVILFLLLVIKMYLTRNPMEARDKFELEMGRLAGEYQFSLTNEIANNATKRWDLIQSRLECCGLRGPQDWSTWRNDSQVQVLPSTCCPSSAFHYQDICRLDNSQQLHRSNGCFGEIEGIRSNVAHIISHVFIHSSLACIALAIVRHRMHDRSSSKSQEATSSMV